MATTYQVQLRDERSHYVLGLSDHDGEESEVLLVYRYRGGDIDTRMQSAEMMHGALYDLYQCHDSLKEGDRFETEFGVYECRGVHVVPVEDEPAVKRARSPKVHSRGIRRAACGATGVHTAEHTSEVTCGSCVFVLLVSDRIDASDARVTDAMRNRAGVRS